MAEPTGFIGRERELTQLLDVLGGDARLLLVVGDAGVGKTRLAGEGMARATAAGMVTARGDACRWRACCRCCRLPRLWPS